MDEEGPAPGTIIGGIYRVDRLLGRGAMGVVMLAKDEVLERSVAIKLIRTELLDSPALRDRFLTEARAMARVNHPNVLHIHAFGEHERAPYLVMELVLGDNAERWIASQKPAVPSVEDALRILEAVCLGVEAIHAAKTVHRDLKPSNIMLDASLRAHVADMGVADLLHRVAAQHTKDIVGTPAYMAPEIARQSDVPRELTHRADVYSLGCIAYELLTGSPPFDAPTPISLMLKHVMDNAVPPSALRPELPLEFDHAILRAMAKDPAERTPSAEAFRRELVAARDRTSEPVRILVAEDDDDFRGALELTLAMEFPYAQIEAVADGAAALAAFDRHHHSVAILDLRMPIIDGLELTGLLRSRESATATPIIVLTASGGPDEWKRLSAMGADGFLVKPVNLKDVVTLVRRALGDRSRSVPPPAKV